MTDKEEKELICRIAMEKLQKTFETITREKDYNNRKLDYELGTFLIRLVRSYFVSLRYTLYGDQDISELNAQIEDFFEHCKIVTLEGLRDAIANSDKIPVEEFTKRQ